MKYLLALLLFAVACLPNPPPEAPGADRHYVGTVMDAVVGLVNDEGRPYCTGVFYRSYIITAYHCVDDRMADGILVGRRNGRVLNTFLDPTEWRVAHTDEMEDLAVLSPISIEEPHYSLVLSPQNPVIGDYVITVGHPYGVTYTVTPGRVTAGVQLRASGRPRTWFTTSADLAPGNSGGPCLNRYGEIFGIASFYYGYPHANKLSAFIHVTAIREAVGEL